MSLSDIFNAPRRRSPARIAPFALLGFFLAVAYAAFYAFTADDALIVARYARNLVTGNGLVFNIGERVSALTSPGHALLLSALTLLPGTPYLLYKALGAGLVVSVLVWMSVRLFDDDWQSFCFLALTAASPFVILWSVGGLETPLLIAVLGAFLVAAWHRDGDDRIAPVAVYGLAALAFLIRHDSALLTAPVVAHQIFVYRRDARHWAWLFAAAAIPAGWLAFAWVYFGDILPTSFYLKTPSLGPDLLRGAIYLMGFLVMTGAVFAALPIWGPAPAGRLRRNLPVLIGLLLFAAYAMTAGTKHMMFSYRLLVPAIPAVALAAMAAGRLAGRRALAFGAVALIVQAGLSVWVYAGTLNPTPMHAFGPGISRMFEYSQQSLNGYAVDFVPAMRANAEDTRTDWEARRLEARPPRVHTFGAGVLPYLYEEAYVLDSLAGYRHDCDFDWADWRRAADYMHVMWPMHGTLEEQLGPLAARVELVSRQVIQFDGRTQHLDVYYNPRPLAKRQSDRVDRPCP